MRLEFPEFGVVALTGIGVAFLHLELSRELGILSFLCEIIEFSVLKVSVSAASNLEPSLADVSVMFGREYVTREKCAFG